MYILHKKYEKKYSCSKIGIMKRKLFVFVCFLAMSLGNGAFAGSAEMFAQHFEAGQNYANQGQYSSSILEFRKALRINYMDNSARIGLINAYLARATFYANQEKNWEKAANDYRSALFYLKMYPLKDQTIQNSSGLIASASENLNQCLRVMSFDKTSQSRYKKGEELRALGNFSAAAFEFSQAAQNQTLAAESYTQIADLMKLLCNEPRSADYFKMALDLDPNNGALKMKYARTLDKIGKFDDAVGQYNSALANSKGDMEILYSLERIYLKKLAQTPSDAELNANIGAIKQAQGDFESALAYYNKAEQLNPNSVSTRLNVGTLYQQKKDYVKALTAYDSVLTMYPDNIQAMMYKAQALTEMGNKKEALSLYQKVIGKDPNNSEAKECLVNVMEGALSPEEYIAYLSKNPNDRTMQNMLYDFAYKLHKENKTDLAISAYKAVIANDSSKVDAYINLAVCYASKEDYSNAQNILNTAKNRFPNNALISKTMSEVQNDSLSVALDAASNSYQNKNYKKAIEQYLAIKPATEDSLLGIAASHQALEDFNKAIEYYKKAEQIAPKNAEIPYYIGYLYSEQQKWNEAESYLKKALALNPNSDAKNILSYVTENSALSELNTGINLFEQNNYESALNKFNIVLKQQANNAYAYYYRALIYDAQKKYQQAIGDYLNVLKNSNEFPIANYMLAVDYDTLEKYKDAFKYYNQFISTYTTDDEYLKYAKSRIEELRPYAS